jgi:hypothetical protein
MLHQRNWESKTGGFMKLLTGLLVTAVLSTTNVYASDVYSDDYQTISSVEMVEVVEDALGNEIEVKLPNSPLLQTEGHTLRSRNKGVGEVLMVARELIAFGKEVYKIIEAGKPVVTIGDTTPISVLPKNAKGKYIEAFDLENWKMPKSKKYRVVAKNGFGMKTITFDFMLIFTYGGSYDGRGAYITGAEVASTDVSVSWGYSLDADFKVQSIVNQGSKENPVAAAVLQIDYKMSTVLKESRSSKKFMINGLGETRSY